MKTIVIGIGHSDRGDDGAGPEVARRLRALVPKDVEVRETCEGGPRLMDLWAGFEKVLLVDAVQSGAAPGTLHAFNASRRPLPAGLLSPVSSHGFGLAETLELARLLGRLPAFLRVYGIEGRDFDHGAGLSSPVAAAVGQALRCLCRDLTVSHEIADCGML